MIQNDSEQSCGLDAGRSNIHALTKQNFRNPLQWETEYDPLFRG